jgi:hypothetical protein
LSVHHWVIRQEIVPKTMETPPISLATIVVRSSQLNLTYTLTDLSTTIDPKVLGLSFAHNVLFLSNQFLQVLGSIRFPLSGSILITDDRMACFTATTTYDGPCQASIKFSLDVAQFNPPCPKNVFLFSKANATIVSWTPPLLAFRNGSAIPLTGTSQPGGAFRQGLTTVSYDASTTLIAHADTSQSPATKVQCSFAVSQYMVSDVALMLLIITRFS